MSTPPTIRELLAELEQAVRYGSPMNRRYIPVIEVLRFSELIKETTDE